MPRGKKPTDLAGQRFGRLVAIERTATYVTGRKPMWLCKCDCGKETLAISQCLVDGKIQSCGCLRDEFLTLGPMKVKTLGRRPQVVKISYPVPDLYPDKPEVNEIIRRRYQFRWERVEHEARQTERGKWKEPVQKAFAPRDDRGNRIIPLDLRGMMEERSKTAQRNRAVPIPEVPSSTIYGASLADRIRVVSDEEWNRL